MRPASALKLRRLTKITEAAMAHNSLQGMPYLGLDWWAAIAYALKSEFRMLWAWHRLAVL